MRLSVDEDDPAYDGPRSYDVNITLDGRVLEDVVTADDAAGECLIFVCDTDDMASGSELQWVTGVVVIEFNAP